MSSEREESTVPTKKAKAAVVESEGTRLSASVMQLSLDPELLSGAHPVTQESEFKFSTYVPPLTREAEVKFESAPSRGAGFMISKVKFRSCEMKTQYIDVVLSATTTVQSVLAALYEKKQMDEGELGLVALRSGQDEITLPFNEPLLPLLDFLRVSDLAVARLVRLCHE